MFRVNRTESPVGASCRRPQPPRIKGLNEDYRNRNSKLHKPNPIKVCTMSQPLRRTIHERIAKIVRPAAMLALVVEFVALLGYASDSAPWRDGWRTVGWWGLMLAGATLLATLPLPFLRIGIPEQELSSVWWCPSLCIAAFFVWLLGPIV
jgi:hypothetical protein